MHAAQPCIAHQPLAANGVTEQSLNDTVLPLLPAPAAGQ